MLSARHHPAHRHHYPTITKKAQLFSVLSPCTKKKETSGDLASKFRGGDSARASTPHPAAAAIRFASVLLDPLIYICFLQKEFNNYKPQAEAATAPPSIPSAAAAVDRRPSTADRQPPTADHRPLTADHRSLDVGRRGRGRGRGRVVSAPRVAHDAATRRVTSHRRARRGATSGAGR